MARETDENIPLSLVNPQYLHANSTSHTWAFSAIAELIDNACDPDVGAKQIWIDWTKIKDFDCLTFTDNGAGMDFDEMHKMLSFGFSDKQALGGRAQVGLYGNGFKSGSMFLGKDAIVFSKNPYSMIVGLLSQTYLADIQAQNVVVPIVTFRKNEENKFSAIPQHRESLKAILEHSLFQTEEQLLSELKIIKGITGTRIIIWNLRSTSSGQIEFEFKEDIADIQIPYVDSTDEQRRPIRRPAWVAEFEFSLRAYCSILYLKPSMQILIKGKKMKTQLVAKSLAHTVKDRYTPKFLNKHIKITFGYRTESGGPYGVLMYCKNRLIRPYVHLGCQLKANAKGVGVIGIIECNFLKPTHNKQEFAESVEYRKIKHCLGVKLEEYWNHMRLKRKEHPSNTGPTDDTKGAAPDQTWVQCNECLKWRKLAGGIDPDSLPYVWVCHMNEDPKFRRCWLPEEPENSEEEQPHEKQYKQEKKKQKQQKKKGQQNSEDSESTPKTSATPSKLYDTRQRIGDAQTSLTSSSSHLSFSGDDPSADTVLTDMVPENPSSRRIREKSLSPPPSFSCSGDDPSADTVLTDMVPENPSSRRIREKSLSPPLPNFSGDDPSADTVLTDMVPENPSSRQKRKLITQENKEGKRAKKIGHQNDTSEAVASTAASALCLPTSPVTATLDENSMQVQTATLEGDQCSEKVETVKQERDQHSYQGETVIQERNQCSEQVETVKQERDQHSYQGETVIQERNQCSEQVETVKQERDQHSEQVETVIQEGDKYREQMETVTQERDLYREQVKTVFRGRDRYRNQVKAVTQERDPYREQVKTVTQMRDQYREQMETATHERDQYREQVKTVIRGRDRYRNQVKAVTQERNEYREQVEAVTEEREQYREQMETATHERDQYREQVKTVTQMRDQYREQMETVTQERDQYREQVKAVIRARDRYRNQVKAVSQERNEYREQVEAVTEERDQYREQMETVTQERDLYREQVKTINQERDQYKTKPLQLFDLQKLI
ncbi:MORC family CW-type zinc finger protein 3-like isoform X2 [Anguilla anguilla]|uniref:MORC family CW-type zinc finger protein 3-like isoform X2 n=1 Tax=Anguilla anguilla TaxID=7936 RepID=UPI0015A7F8AA|nr:MORC family CW-type zinc finger protein 3-like isoform X2 [Anguilla anguilla]